MLRNIYLHCKILHKIRKSVQLFLFKIAQCNQKRAVGVLFYFGWQYLIKNACVM